MNSIEEILNKSKNFIEEQKYDEAFDLLYKHYKKDKRVDELVESLVDKIDEAYERKVLKEYEKITVEELKQEKQYLNVLSSIRLFKVPEAKIVRERIIAALKEYEKRNNEWNLNNYKELDTKEYNNKFKHRKLYASIYGASIGIFVLTSLLLTTFLYIVPSNKESTLLDLMKQGSYNDAKTYIRNNDNIFNKNKLKMFNNACIALDELDYESAINDILSVGGSITVNYDANGGEASIPNEIIKNKRISATASKNEETFYGWKQSEYKVDIENFTAEITLKAQYSPITYRIDWIYTDFGNLDKSKYDLKTEYTVGESILLPELIQQEHTFLGWLGSGLDDYTRTYEFKEGTIGNKSFTAYYEE